MQGLGYKVYDSADLTLIHAERIEANTAIRMVRIVNEVRDQRREGLRGLRILTDSIVDTSPFVTYDDPTFGNDGRQVAAWLKREGIGEKTGLFTQVVSNGEEPDLEQGRLRVVADELEGLSYVFVPNMFGSVSSHSIDPNRMPRDERTHLANSVGYAVDLIHAEVFGQPQIQRA
jgi:hypothetical protein